MHKNAPHVFLFLLGACGGGFSGKDSQPTDTADPSGGADGAEGSGGDDSGGTDGTDGTDGGEGSDGGEASSTPAIEEVQLVVVEFPNSSTGWGLDVRVYYSDLEDDLIGGTLSLHLSDDGETEFDDSLSISDDLAAMTIEAGQISVLFDGASPSHVYEVEASLTDAAGNLSNTEIGEYTPED